MKIKHYKLKDGITREYLLENRCKEGGTWISKDTELFISKTISAKIRTKKGFRYVADSFDICVGFPADLSKWNDFDYIIVIDEDFCQPYTAFYHDNYDKDIKGFPCLEYVIEQYNEFLSSLPFLEEITNGI
jgi:hypothetical protein